MKRSTRTILVIIATLVFAAWTALIGNQHSPIILVLTQLAILSLAIVGLRTPLSGKAIWLLATVGAAVGFVGAILAAAATEIALRGLEQFLDRDFTQNLYFYPSVSLAWLYGAVVIALLFGTSGRSARAA
jgi:hypothetical protein